MATLASRWLNDRFTVSLMLALGLHVLVILALGFGLEFKPLQRAAETLDVVLVNWRSETPPEQAELLAQTSQQGGSDAPEVERPSQNLSSFIPAESPADQPLESEASQPSLAEPEQQRVVEQQADGTPIEERTRPERLEPMPTAADLRRQSMRIAELQQMLQRDEQWRSQLPRRRFISANTREYEFASYMQAWVAKVERVGNLNYPPEVRRLKLVGDLLLTVGINKDGTVESINLRRGSGFPELDEAAIRIVRMAAPYAPLPPNIREHVDVLHITRTWKFTSGYGFE